MLNLNTYAYLSKLRSTDAREKLFFTLATITTCLWLHSVTASLTALFVVCFMTVRLGGIPFPVLRRFLLLPMSFLFISVLTISFSLSPTKDGLLFGVPFFHLFVGPTHAGLATSSILFCKAMAAAACMYFLSLTTPLPELLFALKKFKCPAMLTEMMALIYRFIFILMETAQLIYTAQQSRLGYSSYRLSMRSLAALVSSLFIRSYKRSGQLLTALESRCYEDDLRVLEEPPKTSCKHYFLTLIFCALLVFVAMVV